MFNPDFHRHNRECFMAQLQGGVAIIPSAPEATYSHDVHYVYRQHSDFYYLTGFTEPNSVLVIAPGHKDPVTLFVMPRDLEKEIWNGFRHGTAGAEQTFGASKAYTIDQLAAKLPEYLENTSDLYYAFGRNESFDRVVHEALGVVRGKVRAGVRAPKHFHEPGSILHEMRLIKQDYEVAMMQKASDISVETHKALMQAVRPGMYEYEMDALIQYHFRRHNARYGYPSIIGGGLNATVLHYVENDKQLHDGDLLLVDAGAEYAHYNADITRTFPVNGRFSATQKAVYEVVLAAQLAATAEVRPGNTFLAPHDKAVEILTEGLIDLGLLNGSRDALIESEAYKKFYMHRTGHWIGGDVHDLGEYREADGGSRILQPGMALTIEPGLYFGPHLKGEIPEEFLHIGIRIEDDILVTPEGHHNFTEGVPKAVAEIETLMQA
jgi:Xaa-Pro aminopeptidase